MLYLVGLGPGSAEALPPRAFSLLTGGLPVLVRTERHPVLHSEPLASALAGCDVTPLDDEYEAGASFSDTYDAIVARVLRAHAAQGSLVYAVPGHPLVGETTIARLLAETKRLGVETVSLTPEQATEHFGWLTHFASADRPTSSEVTSTVTLSTKRSCRKATPASMTRFVST